MNIKVIFSAVVMNCNSITKYLEVMTPTSQFEVRYVGNTKLFYLAKRVPLESMIIMEPDMIAVVDKDLRITQAISPFVDFIGGRAAAGKIRIRWPRRVQDLKKNDK